jgi:flagellar biosynthesis protein FlhF
MKIHRFIANDVADAVGQIRSQLGVNAVVLSVSRVPAEGVSRLWAKPRLEVVAGLPENPPPAIAGSGSAPEPGPSGPEPSPLSPAPVVEQEDIAEFHEPSPPALGGAWQSAGILHRMGIQPLFIERVLARVRAAHGENPPSSMAREMALVRSALIGFWRSAPPPQGSPPIHVFVGPPGSGKTTAVCKWMAKFVLAEGCIARAWRLDSRAANFAGLLDVYSEILGVQIQRAWAEPPASGDCDAAFVDFPGVNTSDAAALERLRAQVAAIPGAQVHVVLNAAYDTAVLLQQARAFGVLPVTDLILTHVDEEKRRGKLWNLVLGTNYTIRFLLGGQNIPGDFSLATPELLISR